MLALLLLTAFLAGTFAAGKRLSGAMRSALGLALLAHALFALGLAGRLRAIPLMALALIACAGGVWRMRGKREPDGERSRERMHPLVAISLSLTAAAVFAVTLMPPLAFDETLYHLPFVQAFARSGAVEFLPELRFPVFPILQELLALGPYLAAGDTATHVVSFAEVCILAALMIEWGNRHVPRAGALAAALFLGSPLLVHLSSVLYVELALTLFVVAGFLSLERRHHTLAGLLLGTACSVKYLGFYFAAMALVVVVRRREGIARFLAAAGAAALPTTMWIFLKSGDPFFPFLGKSQWSLGVGREIEPLDRLTGLLRLVWDVTFARDRAGMQPPITPLLTVIVIFVAMAAKRDVHARWLLVAGAGYVAILSFLLQDARYLVPLLALLCIPAAVLVAQRWPRAVTPLAVCALLPALAYASYRLSILGPPPAAAARRQWLSARVPEYRALLQAGSSSVYVCGGENLKAYAARVLGDHAGPSSFARILGDGGAAAATRLRGLGIETLLVAKGKCPHPPPYAGMTLVYEDEAAQLWRIANVAPDAESGTPPSPAISR